MIKQLVFSNLFDCLIGGLLDICINVKVRDK